MIRRHSSSAIFMHWFNAICWIFLLLSGFALLVGEMQPVGDWLRTFFLELFGETRLLYAHLYVGTVWVVGYLIYLLMRFRSEVLPFIKEITRFHAASDAMWCLKKGLWLILGPRLTKKFGIDPKLPPQGFYNAGQRAVAVCAVVASIVLAITGVVMGFLSGNQLAGLGILMHADQVQALLQWCIYLHFVSAAVMAVFLPIHIYMAALAPGEGPALKSMFTGFVPEEHVRHHNTLWYEKLVQEGKIQA